jgi:hypothetical protein
MENEQAVEKAREQLAKKNFLPLDGGGWRWG